jgi:hypothetical protein
VSSLISVVENGKVAHAKEMLAQLEAAREDLDMELRRGDPFRDAFAPFLDRTRTHLWIARARAGTPQAGGEGYKRLEGKRRAYGEALGRVVTSIPQAEHEVEAAMCKALAG